MSATLTMTDAAAPAAPPLLPLRLKGVGFSAGGRALLDGIDLTIEQGRRLVVMGPNGAGKSLLLRICHGLLAPHRGQVIWADGSTRPEAQAMVLQRPVLLRRSVAANLEYPLGLRRATRAQRREIAAATLDRFGLAHLAGSPARLLSGGEQQRLALARAWVTRPQVLFLDEPSSALDPSATRLIEQMIADFSADGITVVMTTHDLGQARRLAHDIAFLNAGRLIDHSRAADFFAGRSSREARAFVAGELIW